MGVEPFALRDRPITMSSHQRPSPDPNSRPVVGSRLGKVLSVVAAALLVAGCGQPGSRQPSADTPEVDTNELADAGGQPCPQDLPLGDDPSGHGWGTDEVAVEAPTFLEPELAWVCRYEAADAGAAPGGGRAHVWRRVGQPEAVPGSGLPDLRSALDAVVPADRVRGCDSDLGPRWVVVSSHDGDLTGVVVDDYGCRDVRLSDNPHVTPPGEGDQIGMVGGVFDGGAAILLALGVGRAS